MWRDAQRLNHFVIQNAHATGRDGAHGQLLLARCSELAHQKDIQRSVQRSRNFTGHRHAATR